MNYFAEGHSSRCFLFVKDWVEKKVRRHLKRAQNRFYRRRADCSALLRFWRAGV
ncbi:MAG: hypothetical protein OZ929_16100 [Bryobacterales bacterium]|nr:hypothetical protein [Bryobacterales bacterium]